MEHRDVDTCIVGAGFSGIAAARALVGARREVVILEARDRVGGRAWNRTMDDGTVVSVGGTWLGKGHNRLFALCAEQGLPVYEQYEDGASLVRLDEQNHRYSGLVPRVGLAAIASMGLTVLRLDRMTKRIPVEQPWTARDAAKLDAQTLGQFIDDPLRIPSKRGRAMLRAGFSLLFCVDPDEVSMLGSQVLAAGGGSFQYYMDTKQTETHLVAGGVPELANRLAAELGQRVELSSPVRRIRQDGARVIVESDRVEVHAAHVIVATPPLLASRIDYAPDLPDDTARLLSAYAPGTIMRGIAVYDDPFWRADGLTGETLAPQSPVVVSIDQSGPGGRPGVISSYAVGREASRLAAIDPAERRQLWLNELAARFGPRAKEPRAFLETDWSAEPWSLGGMIGHLPTGVLSACGAALRRPFGRIHWAGTEQATRMHGLIEGAVLAGERAAAEILSEG